MPYVVHQWKTPYVRKCYPLCPTISTQAQPPALHARGDPTIANSTERCICPVAENRHRGTKRVPLRRRIHNLCATAVIAASFKRTERRTPFTTPNVQIHRPIFCRIHRGRRRDSVFRSRTHPRMETEN